MVALLVALVVCLELSFAQELLALAFAVKVRTSMAALAGHNPKSE